MRSAAQSDGGESADLSVSKRVKIIREAARARRFISYGHIYGHIARRHGLDWNRDRFRLFQHLDVVGEWGYRSLEDRPMLTAIVVSEPRVADGLLEGKSLQGFLELATALGCQVGSDPVAFLRAEQEKTFAWAARGA